MRSGSLVLLMLVGAGGCSRYWVAHPAAPPIDALGRPPSGLGQLCVVRPAWGASAVTLVVRDNGNLVGATHGPSYFCYFAEPGSHRILSEVSDAGMVVKSSETTVDVARGGRYFLQQTVEASDTVLSFLTEADAAKIVDRCGYQVLIAAPPSDSLPGMTPVAGARPIKSEP
jgi:hypothetical protein